MAVIPPRMKAKLDKSLAQGEFYEAHQLYRTLYFRYITQKDHNKAMDLLYQGAIAMFDNNQILPGSDLSELFIDVLSAYKCAPNDQLLDRIQHLYARIPPSTMSESKRDKNGKKEPLKDITMMDEPSHPVDRHKFTNELIKWAKDVGAESKAHGCIARVLWQEQSYTSARSHFIVSHDAQAFASCLIEEQTKHGYKNELDLFLAQAVLQYLARSDKNSALTVFNEYTSSHPQISQPPPFKLPLLNFIWLLLLCVDLKQVTYYTIIIEHYQPSIRRDPTYSAYLDKIGQLYFGLPPPQKAQKPGGIFSNLLQGLFGGAAGPGHSSELPSSNNDDDFQSVSSSLDDDERPNRAMAEQDLD